MIDTQLHSTRSGSGAATVGALSVVGFDFKTYSGSGEATVGALSVEASGSSLLNGAEITNIEKVGTYSWSFWAHVDSDSPSDVYYFTWN